MAKDDSEVDISGEGPAYTPNEDAFEQESLTEEELEAYEAAEAEPKDEQAASDLGSLPPSAEQPAQTIVR